MQVASALIHSVEVMLTSYFTLLGQKTEADLDVDVNFDSDTLKPPINAEQFAQFFVQKYTNTTSSLKQNSQIQAHMRWKPNRFPDPDQV